MRGTFVSQITNMKLPVLSLKDILSVIRCTMGFLVQFIGYFVLSFNTPLLSNHLTEAGYSPVFMGSSMISASASYIISMFVVAALTKHISKKGILLIGLFTQTTGCLISGLDRIHEFYNPGLFTIVGISLMGLGMGMSLIPVMPEIIEGIESHPRFAFAYDEITLQNNLAGYFICCQALGEALGPLASSLLERGIEFRNTQITLCIFTSLFLIIYMFSCGVFGFFKLKPHVKSYRPGEDQVESIV